VILYEFDVIPVPCLAGRLKDRSKYLDNMRHSVAVSMEAGAGRIIYHHSPTLGTSGDETYLVLSRLMSGTHDAPDYRIVKVGPIKDKERLFHIYYGGEAARQILHQLRDHVRECGNGFLSWCTEG
jgi:hypothetical protein